MILSPLRLPFLFLLFSCATQLAAQDISTPIRSVITFGDSLSDAGSFGSVYGTTPGSSWPQLLARSYGDDQTPYLLAFGGQVIRILGGLNYAQGGSKTAAPAKRGAAEDSIPHSAEVQIRNHLNYFGRIKADQLVIIWTGCNDIISLFGNGDPTTWTAEESALNTGRNLSPELYAASEEKVRAAARAEVRLVGQLLANGATKIVVMNLPDLGMTPFQPNTTPAGLKIATRLTSVYNHDLAAALPRAPELLLVDADGFLQKAAHNLAGSGFKYVLEDACANSDFICGPAHYSEPDANETHMFAGYGHFTEHSRRLVASEVITQINARWFTRKQ